MAAIRITVKGLVQGVGFRPTVWRLAVSLGLTGQVWNDSGGVCINAWGDDEPLAEFRKRLFIDAPLLAEIESVAVELADSSNPPFEFVIKESTLAEPLTGIAPDAATCPDCLAEINNWQERRFEYGFANCTNCGPRLSIVSAIPWDRANTSMDQFTMCADCRQEYNNPADRRFHAQPVACPACGPSLSLLDAAGKVVETDSPISRFTDWLDQGCILGVKGIGGFHLACDAMQEPVVTRLRSRKRRWDKPFALMARDLGVVRRFCEVNSLDEELLTSPAAPIVIMGRKSNSELTSEIAPGQSTLGFMLPYSPLHHLLMKDRQSPLIMTSANFSDEPPCIDNAMAVKLLDRLVDGLLVHDRNVINRVDDSVVRVVGGETRMLRRARGYAPGTLGLPPGFAGCPDSLAMGADLKNTFCLVKEGRAIVSQHLGDLEDARTHTDYENCLDLYTHLYRHDPSQIVVDMHPGYHCVSTGKMRAKLLGVPVLQVQHHHAHIAACLAENKRPLAAAPVLGIALDGLGYGADGNLWGGEFLRVDYRSSSRLGCLANVPMYGGSRAILQPWRMAYAHLNRLGWLRIAEKYPDLSIMKLLASKPLATFDNMLNKALNTPLTSSCGRLFDAAAAILGVRRDDISYEGQAAIELENMSAETSASYTLDLRTENELLILDPKPMWEQMLADLAAEKSAALLAGKFHNGLAEGIVRTGLLLMKREGLSTVALSGGVFQNERLFKLISAGFKAAGVEVLTHTKVPCNDGGIALGQSVVAAAQDC